MAEDVSFHGPLVQSRSVLLQGLDIRRSSGLWNEMTGVRSGIMHLINVHNFKIHIHVKREREGKKL